MKSIMALFIGLLFISSGIAVGKTQDKFVELDDYIVLDNAKKSKSKTIIVREAFWYGCPHCNVLLPYLTSWEKRKPKNVIVELMPIPGNDDSSIWTFHAKVFYALEQLKKIKETHAALFYAIHKQRKPANNINQIADIVRSHGISKQQLTDAMKSFPVALKLKKTRELAAKYGLDGVPALIVNDKYVITSSSAKGYGRMFNILDFLIKKIKAENGIK